MSFAAVLERLAKIENPYPGLRPFNTSDGHLFFGRGAQIDELVTRLQRHRFVAVIGVSGSGKSSLVLAGLIPALLRGQLRDGSRRWRIVRTRPAGRPFASLTEDLEKAGLDPAGIANSSHGLIKIAEQLSEDESLLLVVDQFEELFRYKDVHNEIELSSPEKTAAAAEASDFVQMLLASSRHQPPIFVVLTMRSDYLGDCAEFRDLPEALNESQYLVPRLTRQERKEAIECPLGLTPIAPSLVQQLLNDVGDEPDQLPILQHALMRTWDEWHKTDPEQTRGLKLDDYVEIGGFGSALDKHGDQLLTEVSPVITETIFRRLTAKGRGTHERRDPARLKDLWALCGAETDREREDVNAVIERLRRPDASFLWTRRPPTLETPDLFVDITHESLIRLWSKLRERWLPLETHAVRTFLSLVERARKWKNDPKHSTLTGLDLTDALDWNRDRNPSPVWARHYADASALDDVITFTQVSASEEQSRKRAEKRRQWKLTAAVAVVLLAYIAISSWYRTKLQGEKNRAEGLRQDAVAAAKTAENTLKELSRSEAGRQSQAVGAVATGLASWDPSLAMAVLKDADSQALESARMSILPVLDAPLWQTTIQHDAAVFFASFDPTSKLIATASFDKTARISNLDGTVLATLVHGGPVMSATFAPDGKTVLTTSDDNKARVWNLKGTMLALFDSEPRDLSSLGGSLGPGGLVLTTTGGGVARLVTRSGRVIKEWDAASQVQFSKDGQFVLTVGSNAVRLWKTDGSPAGPEVKLGTVQFAVLTPDAKGIITFSEGRIGYVSSTGSWASEMKSDKDSEVPFGHVDDAAVSSDGMHAVATSTNSASAVLWKLPEHDAAAAMISRLLLEGHSEPLFGAEFSHDGRQIVTASLDGTARLWDLKGHMLAVLQGHSGGVLHAEFSKDDRYVVTTSVDGQARVWNVSDRVARRFEHKESVTEGSFSPDGHHFLTVADQTTIWDRDGHGALLDRRPSDDYGYRAAFHPVRPLVATVGKSGLRMWSTTVTPPRLLPALPDAAQIRDFAFSGNGDYVLTSTERGVVRIQHLDGRPGIQLATVIAPVPPSAPFERSTEGVAISHDGSRVVTIDQRSAAAVWDTAVPERPLRALVDTAEPNDRVTFASFSPDGKWILTGSDSGARLWTRDGRRIESFKTPDEFNAAAFSPNSELIAVASSNPAPLIRLFDLAGHVQTTLMGHMEDINRAAFSPDGQYVLAVSDDHEARLWNLRGALLMRMRHADDIKWAGFSPKGDYILTSSGDGTAKLWPVGTQALADRLRQLRVPCLSLSDRQRFLLENPVDATKRASACMAVGTAKR